MSLYATWQRLSSSQTKLQRYRKSYVSTVKSLQSRMRAWHNSTTAKQFNNRYRHVKVKH